MPYKKVSDINPKIRKHLTPHGSEIYKAAFNNAYKEYGDEETAHKVANAAVTKAGARKESFTGIVNEFTLPELGYATLGSATLGGGIQAYRKHLHRKNPKKFKDPGSITKGVLIGGAVPVATVLAANVVDNVHSAFEGIVEEMLPVFGDHGDLLHADKPGDMELSYKWTHLPSGKTGVKTARFLNQDAYHSSLSRWNQSPDWKYEPVHEALSPRAKRILGHAAVGAAVGGLAKYIEDPGDHSKKARRKRLAGALAGGALGGLEGGLHSEIDAHESKLQELSPRLKNLASIDKASQGPFFRKAIRKIARKGTLSKTYTYPDHPINKYAKKFRGESFQTIVEGKLLQFRGKSEPPAGRPKTPDDVLALGLDAPTLSTKIYKCKDCGEHQKITTNHYGDVSDYCNGCSWKPSFGETGHKIPALGPQTFRRFEFVKDVEEEE